MKRLISVFLVALLMMCAFSACAEQELIDYIVNLVNTYAEQLSFIEKCVYDNEADAITLIMLLEIDSSTLNSLDEETKKELYMTYMQGDGVLTGSCEIAEVDTTTISIAKTSDNVPFFLSVNGVDHSWLFE